MTEHVDAIVIGGGMAGASVAYWLSADANVAVLEREADAGYHSTGRSAAVWFLSYGSAQIRAVTAASRPFFDEPPDGFADYPLLASRGALMVADHDQLGELDEFWESVRDVEAGARWLDAGEACDRVPVLRHSRVAAAVAAPELFDIDVDVVLHGFLRGVSANGGSFVNRCEVGAIERRGDRWQVDTSQGRWTADLVVNAAGAWADRVAGLAGVAPIGLVPKRRSAFIFDPPPGVATGDWPLLIGASEDWYVKPDAGMLLGSPANADPVEPHDVRPEELDIAKAIERIGEMTTMEIRRPTRTWAGLRSFVDDGGLVGGPDPDEPSFVWSAGQGGYGIQTAPAMGEACAALALGRPVPDHLAAFGVTADALSVERLRPGGGG